MCFFSIVFPVVKKKACNNKLISGNIALICYLFKKSLLLLVKLVLLIAFTFQQLLNDYLFI